MMRYATATIATLSLVASSCATRPEAVQGRAQVLSWNDDARVVLLCESKQRYQLGIFTSVASAESLDVDRAIEADPGSLLINLAGFPASLPSGWQPSPDVDGILSVGHIAVAGRGRCT